LALIDEPTINNIMTDIKKLNNLTKKEYLKILFFVITFLIARTIFSDWNHLKAGLFGY
jgi:predicted membrane protein